jgi:hypothetical protein
MSTNEVKILPGNVLEIEGLRLTFQRTLRIPDDGRHYPLPPGLGAFPLRRVDDHASRVPADWTAHGGVFLPMYQREAMWLSFSGAPRALQIGVGKVCAVSGGIFGADLRSKPQNYVVTGAQPWLDGIASGKGTIRQFVAMPLGHGYTVEGQVTGEERFGGIQLKAFRPKPGRLPIPSLDEELCCAAPCSPMSLGAPAPGAMPAARGRFGGIAPQRVSAASAMGLAAGGRMKQKVYPDPHGTDTWDESATSRVFVHLVNSEMWREITGEAPPVSPVSAKSYAVAGLPWFELYDEHAATIDPTSTLAAVKSVKQLDATKSTLPLQNDESVEPSLVKKLAGKLAGVLGVRDGDW